MTKAQREEAARKGACPRCHVAAGNKCRNMGGHPRGIREPMKGIHAERLVLVLECRCGNQGTLRADPFDAEVREKVNMKILCRDCYGELAGDI